MADISIIDRYQGNAGLHGYERIRAIPNSYRSEVLLPFTNEINTSGEKDIVLDLASGTGLGGNSIEELGFTVVKLDVSMSGLKRSGGKRVRSFAEELPFEDKSITAVHMKDALVHVADKNSLMSEISRVLKPGGVALFVSQISKGNFISIGRKNLQVGFNESDDIKKVYKAIREHFGRKTLSPPYYASTPTQVNKCAQNNGLILSKIWTWEPKEGEKDWHKVPAVRFVSLFQKEE